MSKKPRIGKTPTRYKLFFLNPYEDVRFSYCPKCEGKTKLRKVPLVVHLEPMQPVVLNKSCRYCPSCDLLIAHQDEVEHLLTLLVSDKQQSESIADDYLVMGTMDRSDWQRTRKQPTTTQEMLDCLYVFKQVLHFEPKRYMWLPDEK